MDSLFITADWLVFAIYFVFIVAYGLYIYYKNKTSSADSKAFFLAEGSLTWWAIGASLIASNISAEQFIGMSGSGFQMGLAIASYEWMAAATLILIAIFFLPIYLNNGIFTMPQFLAFRYNESVALVMAVFWLLVYVFINLTSILYLGALALTTVSGISFELCIFLLALFAIIITLGGMKVIGYTDVIQVLVLILGGLATTYLALDLVAKQYNYTGAIAGFNQLITNAPDHFDMIFDKANPHYKSLPGLGVILGGMWIANLNYWGCNQYITQRALGASLPTARKGLLFAAFLKLLMPIIVVIPGIAAYALYQNGLLQQEMVDGVGKLKPDHAYPVLLNLLPHGLKGLAFAALTAAIVASLAGKANSISTIFTLDIYKKFMDKTAGEKKLVLIGRIAIVMSLVIGVLIAPQLKTFDQGFQFIQDFTGLISPGVTAIFLMGMFWKGTTGNAALSAAFITIPLSIGFKYLTPSMPFLDRMGYVFLILCIWLVVISLIENKGQASTKSIKINSADFKVEPTFIAGSVIVMGILSALYFIFW